MNLQDVKTKWIMLVGRFTFSPVVADNVCDDISLVYVDITWAITPKNELTIH
jgi:hypothetical protein